MGKWNTWHRRFWLSRDQTLAKGKHDTKKTFNQKNLTKEQQKENRRISRERVLNENVIGKLKRFKILSDKYRNRRKRFSLRFNLIAGIYNLELEEQRSKLL